jgi:hypothetical protein
LDVTAGQGTIVTDIVTLAKEDPRRRSLRHRVFLGGKAVFGPQQYSLDCVIRNLSAYGARLEIPKGQTITDGFELIEMRNGAVYKCQAVWHEYPQVGVVFLDREMLDNAKDPHGLVRG